jgi:polyvinyl alcohol dehydrogenase (cytochrome)
MAHQGAKIEDADRVLLARWLGSESATVAAPVSNRCTGPAANAPKGSWEHWGGGLSNWRYQAAAAAGIAAKDVGRLKVKWAFGFPNASMVRSQPAVVNGTVFAGSEDGTVYALDASTGCVYWNANIGAEVRSSITVGAAGSRRALFAGDSAGNVHALDANTGTSLWKRRMDEHPATRITAAPVYWKGRLYVPISSSEEASALQPGYVCCTFRGSVMAVDAETGRALWKSYTIAQPPTQKLTTRRGTDTLGPSGAAVWSVPTIDPERNALYVTTGDNYSDPTTETSDAVIAFDLDSGKMLWSRQFTKGDAMNLSCWHDKANCPDSEGPDFDFGAPAMLVRISKTRRALILGQKSGMAYAVDPDRKGELLWEVRAGEGGVAGGIQWGMATDGTRVYIAVSDMGMKPPAKRVPGGPRYDIDPAQGGGLLALRANDGARRWRSPAPGCGERRPCSPAQIAPVTAVPGVVFSGSVDGHIRAYASNSGRVVWDFDTVQGFDTVNGVSARGGSLDVAGPVVAGGMVYVNSGYNFLGGLPGNVLLAFSVDGK